MDGGRLYLSVESPEIIDRGNKQRSEIENARKLYIDRLRRMRGPWSRQASDYKDYGPALSVTARSREQELRKDEPLTVQDATVIDYLLAINIHGQ